MINKIYDYFNLYPWMFWWYALTPSTEICSRCPEYAPACEYFYGSYLDDDILVLVVDEDLRLVINTIEYLSFENRVYFL